MARRGQTEFSRRASLPLQDERRMDEEEIKVFELAVNFVAMKKAGQARKDATYPKATSCEPKRFGRAAALKAD